MNLKKHTNISIIIHKNEKVNIYRKIVYITVLAALIAMLHRINAIYNIDAPIVILKNDFVDGIEYLYNCTKLGSK